MTTYPAPSDPVSALTFPDGTSRAHSLDHGRIGDFHVNAKQYLRGDNSTESASQITALSTAASGKRVFWPPGIYRMPNGSGLTLSAGTHHIGVPGQTYITTKDAYAFTISGANSASVEDMLVVCIAGNTTGGAVKTTGTTSNNVRLRNIYGYADDTGGTKPMYDLSSIIGAHIEGCVAETAPIGFYVHPGSGFVNSNTILRCRAVPGNNANTYATESAGSINAGIVAETQQLAIYSTILESAFHGYGFYGRGLSGGKIEDIWFEANQKHNCVIENSHGFIVRDSKFQANFSGDATAKHIVMTVDAGPGGTGGVLIEGNDFQDGPTSGTYISIGSNVEDTKVAFNRNLTDSVISDSGTRTSFLMNHGVANKIADAFTGAITLTGSTQTGDNGSLTGTGLFAISDTLGEDEFGVIRKGNAVFHTKNGDPGSGVIPSNSVTFYWHEASGQIRARTRNNSGAEATSIVGYPTSAAYTTSNVTTDRTYDANATTTDELADVLGTLIADLKTAGILS